MRGAVLHGPRDVRLEERDEPRIEEPQDAVIRLAATSLGRSWPSASEPPTSLPNGAMPEWPVSRT
jgi:hypothetical protein